MLTAASHIVRASISPASRAYWWPRLWARARPRTRGSAALMLFIMSQVPSVLPSSTSSRKLPLSAMPRLAISSMRAKSSGTLMGRACVSL